MTFYIKELKTITEIKEFAPAWNDFCIKVESEIFQTPSWLIPWYENTEIEGKTPFLFCFYSSDRLIGIMPMVEYREKKLVSIPVLDLAGGDSLTCSDHLGLIGNSFKQCYKLLKEKSKDSIIRLSSIDENGLFATKMREFLSRDKKNLIWFVFRKEETNAINLPDTIDAYLRSLNKKFRREIKRMKERLIEECNASFSIEKENIDEKLIDDTFNLHSLSFSRRGDSSINDLSFRTFLKDVFINLSKKQLLGVVQCKVNSELVGSLILFYWEKKVYAYQLGWDIKFSSYSLGKLLFIEAIIDAIRQGYEEFDLLRGSESYKQTLRGSSFPLIGLEFSSSWKGKLVIFMRFVRSKIHRRMFC